MAFSRFSVKSEEKTKKFIKTKPQVNELARAFSKNKINPKPKLGDSLEKKYSNFLKKGRGISKK